MLREEEDDMTQEIRQFVVFAIDNEIKKLVQKITDLRVESTSEYLDGVNDGLALAVKALHRDKSATQVASQSRKHRGYRSQKVLANFLAENGFPFAESTGAGRSGSDVTGTVGIDWEVKARTGFNPAAAIAQLKDRDKGDLGIVVLRLNGQGEKSVGDWVSLMRTEDLVWLLREAGYGDKN